MNIKEIIEFIFGSALFINAALFIPQAIKIFKEKTAAGISIITFIGFLLIQFSTVLYGIINQDHLLVFGYLLSMLTCGTVIILTLFFKTRPPIFPEQNISADELLNQIPEHIYWKNYDGIMLGCNTKNWQDFGLKSLADYIGKTDYDLFPKDQAEKLREADLKVMNSGQATIVEEESTRADGKVGLYLSHKIPLRNRNNKIIGILGVSIDITDARKKEIDRLEFLESIIARTPGHVYWLNRDNVYLGCNDNQAKSAGLNSRKEIIGKRNKDLPWNADVGGTPPEILDKVNEEVMETGKTIIIEEPGALLDGTKVIYLSNKAPIRNSDGEIIGMVGISMDITEQHKKAEEELHEIQQRLDGMTLVSAAIAHELRTPLTAFGAATSNMKKAFPRLKEAYLWAKEKNAPIENITPQYFDYIDETLVSMRKEIQDAFTFIDISLKNTNPAIDKGKPEILSISDVVEDALARYPFMAGQRELVRWENNSNTYFTIKSDRLLLTHVLFNLLKNALYYLATAGKGNITIWLEPGTPNNTLYFKDTGTGIASDILPHIFERFFSRTHSSAHPAGIGLTFCKTVMDSINGEISCQSVEGDYTLFILKFPSNISST